MNIISVGILDNRMAGVIEYELLIHRKISLYNIIGVQNDGAKSQRSGLGA